jgi:hypothetical protein
MNHETRESWLTAAVEAMRPWFADVGAPLPEKIRVSCAWSKRASADAIAWCWKSEASGDGHNELMVSPELADPIRVLAGLGHELVHASDNGASKHSGHFRTTALALGLTGKMTHTTAGPELAERLGNLSSELGPYPHAKLTPALQISKQTTRMLKAQCPDDGYTVRLTKKWADVGMPICPCGNEMEMQ